MRTHKSGLKASSKVLLNRSEASDTTTVLLSEGTTLNDSGSDPDYFPPEKLWKIHEQYSEGSAVDS